MIAGLVLAAGAGRRFGEEAPKQLATLHGRPLLEHALVAMARAPLDRLAVVLGARAEEIRARVDLHGAEPVVAADWEEGMAASLRAGVAALAGADAVVIALGDEPGLEPAAVARVIAHRGPPALAVRATYAGRPGHPVLLEAPLLERVELLRGDVGAGALPSPPPARGAGPRRPVPGPARRRRHPRGAGGDQPMKLEQSFTVRAPIDEVWAALTDVERVAPCLPGAEITGMDEDGAYQGTFSVKLGPASAAYRGSLRMESADDATHTVTMRAEGRDKRGQGSARATIVSRLAPDGAATRVDVETDFTITGRLARFGRGGMIADISQHLLEDFASCLQEKLGGAAPPAPEAPAPAPETAPPAAEAAPAPPAPDPAQPPPAAGINGFQLLMRVLRDRLRRLFGRA